MKIRRQIKEWLNWDALPVEERRRRLDRYLPPLRLLARIAGFLRLDIRIIALLSLTDKVGAHEYADAYAHHFRPYRNKKITLLEIGVGGYTYEEGGRSLVLWESYFRRASIAGVDIYDKTHLSRGRIRVFQASQTDEEKLNGIAQLYNGFDIIIDDGSHVSSHIIETFKILFDKVKPGGIYVIEDLGCSYLPEYGGGEIGSDGYRGSAMHFLSNMIDAVNSPPVAGETTAEPYTAKIASMHFYEELCLIRKR
jgi:demethylmacrocin O-methyltransferase